MRELPALRALMSSRFYPAVLQWPTVAVFAAIVFHLVSGPPAAEANPGTVLTLLLWWPALGVMFLLAGRAWCAACPFSFISDRVQRMVGNNIPAPRLLKRHGAWIVVGLFLVLTWCEEFFHIVHSTLATAFLLMLLITGVVASGAFFERRTWCRYLCPLGGMAGIYSRTGILQLRGTRDKCLKCSSVECYKGGARAPGCAMFEFPRILDSSANCNFCGACVKNCPQDSLVVSARLPSRELWGIGRPRIEESTFAAVMAGILVMLNTMEVAGGWLPAALGGGNEALGFTVFYVGAITAPVAAMLLAARLASGADGDPTRTNFALFGYALIPVVLAAHVGHTGKEFLEKGLRIPASLGFLLPSGAGGPEAAALLGSEGILVVHLLVLAAGAWLSLHTSWRMARERFRPGRRSGFMLPVSALVAAFATLNTLLVLAGD